MSNVETEIRTHVDAFVSQLSALVRKAALEAVADALREGQPGAARKPGRAKGAPQQPPQQEVRKAGRPVRAAKPARKKGEKRSKEELAAMTQRVLEHIRGNSGQGVEQIAKELVTTTKELTLPIKKLLADKKITSKGEKRATKYFSR